MLLHFTIINILQIRLINVGKPSPQIKNQIPLVCTPKPSSYKCQVETKTSVQVHKEKQVTKHEVNIIFHLLRNVSK